MGTRRNKIAGTALFCFVFATAIGGCTTPPPATGGTMSEAGSGTVRAGDGTRTDVTAGSPLNNAIRYQVLETR